MYEKKMKQVSLDENPNSFNRLPTQPGKPVGQADANYPWSRLDGRHHRTFANPKVGNPAKSCRMAIGSLIMKERMKLSDIEIVEQIRENPYMQYFIGLNNFTDHMLFVASTMTYFRKRLTPEILAKINALIVDESKDDDDHDDDAGSDAETPEENKSEPKNKGTLILNATCEPADILFPTDVALLNDSRVMQEELIDRMHEGSDEMIPRTSRQKARTIYLRYAATADRVTNRFAVPSVSNWDSSAGISIWSRIFFPPATASVRQQMQNWQTIQDVYLQQQEMYREKKHKVEDRIVSIHQPWVSRLSG